MLVYYIDSIKLNVQFVYFGCDQETKVILLSKYAMLFAKLSDDPQQMYYMAAYQNPLWYQLKHL